MPVLTYHGLSHEGDSGNKLHVSVAAFEEQMQYLKREKYHVVSLAALKRNEPPNGVDPKKMVAITFDDGYVSQLKDAAPILDRLNFRATLFVVTHWLDQVFDPQNLPGALAEGDSFMDWSSVNELVERGWWIGSHTVSHADCSRVPISKLELELRYSYQAINDFVGRAPYALAFPGGRSDATAQQVARKYYPQSFGIHPGLAERRKTLRYHQPRIEINADDTLQTFIRKLKIGTSEANPTVYAAQGLQGFPKGVNSSRTQSVRSLVARLNF